ncbi:MAG: FAD-dependent oxidoreductase [Methanomassiliicoccales archaeon]|nr:MAG: FAD-dependent oxidoreductase [Methanomassiliicoccales archaeon]
MRVDVLIIGGGATGVGIARDLSMRGVDVLLLEKSDFGSGSSGGNHGLLHSGARYVINDPISAKECAAESKILKKVAWNCIDDTGGLFVGLKGDDPEHGSRFEGSCRSLRINVHHVGKDEIWELEPNISKDAEEGYLVEDAAIDPFRLVLTNVDDARRNGATLRNHCEVIDVETTGEEVRAVRFRDMRNGDVDEVYPEIVVNAAGPQAAAVAKMAGINLGLTRDFGTLLVYNGRTVRRVINRLRPPSDGDIIVPSHTSMVAGTTSRRLRPSENGCPTRADVEKISKEASALVPSLETMRVIRAYGSSRPLISSEGGRTASRGYKVIDHATDGVEGMISIIGGKLTTYRLMAESVSDLVCRKLGVRADCRTATEVMVEKRVGLNFPSTKAVKDSISRRYGNAQNAHLWIESNGTGMDLACSCEGVLQTELERFSASGDILNLTDLMRRTRAGMGYCQGTGCMWRMVAALSKGDDVQELVEDFIRERRAAMESVLEGDQLRQEIFRSHILWNYLSEKDERET